MIGHDETTFYKPIFDSVMNERNTVIQNYNIAISFKNEILASIKTDFIESVLDSPAFGYYSSREGNSVSFKMNEEQLKQAAAITFLNKTD